MANWELSVPVGAKRRVLWRDAMELLRLSHATGQADKPEGKSLECTRIFRNPVHSIKSYTNSLLLEVL